LAKVRQDHVPLRASALSFQTLASMVPLIVIVLAVFSGPIFLSQREQMLDKLVEVLVPEKRAWAEVADEGEAPAGHNSSVNDVRRDVQERLKERVRGTVGALTENLGKVSALSFVALLIVASMVFRTVEDTFNAIWKVDVGRPIFIKMAITTGLLFWGPLMLILSIGITETLKARIPFVGTYVLPTLLTALALTAFYMLMPYAKVRLSAALVCGLVSAVLWELTKSGFLMYVDFAVSMSMVYGPLAIIPIVFLWVYLSWLVVLVGAELGYVMQHHRAIAAQWEQRQRERRIVDNAQDWAQRDAALLPTLALAAALEITIRFRAGTSSGGARLSELTEVLGAELGVLDRALERLCVAGVLVKIVAKDLGDHHDARYLPARDPAQIPLAELAAACRGTLPLAGEGASWRIAMETVAKLEREGVQAVDLKTLADLLPAPTTLTPFPATDVLRETTATARPRNSST